MLGKKKSFEIRAASWPDLYFVNLFHVCLPKFPHVGKYQKKVLNKTWQLLGIGLLREEKMKIASVSRKCKPKVVSRLMLNSQFSQTWWLLQTLVLLNLQNCNFCFYLLFSLYSFICFFSLSFSNSTSNFDDCWELPKTN